jgi:hypothetical protein
VSGWRLIIRRHVAQLEGATCPPHFCSCGCIKVYGSPRGSTPGPPPNHDLWFIYVTCGLCIRADLCFGNGCILNGQPPVTATMLYDHPFDYWRGRNFKWTVVPLVCSHDQWLTLCAHVSNGLTLPSFKWSHKPMCSPLVKLRSTLGAGAFLCARTWPHGPHAPNTSEFGGFILVNCSTV